MGVLENITINSEHLKEKVKGINECVDKNLWHDVIEKLEELFSLVKNGEQLYKLYDELLSNFDLKLNLLKLANLVIIIAEKQTNVKKSIELIEKVKKKIIDAKMDNIQAIVTLDIELAFFEISLKDYSKAKKLLENSKESIEKQGFEIDNFVHSRYYKVKAEYYKSTEDANLFYKTSLLYLAFTPLKDLNLIEQQKIAYDIGISALLGDKIYNFGELLGHDIVKSLDSSKADWLLKLLISFNKGDINNFKKIVSSAPLTQPLKLNSKFLIEKIQLMSILELVFNKPTNQRKIKFKEICENTGRNLNDIEFLLLKALGLNLIKGSIDQVSQTIYVTWVQPRVLNVSQIKKVQGHIDKWLNKVESTLKYLENEGEKEIKV